MKLKVACPVCDVTYLLPATFDVTFDPDDPLTIVFGDARIDAHQYVTHAIDAHGLDPDEGARIVADMA